MIRALAVAVAMAGMLLVAAPAAAAAGCVVTDASLSWGFKESFRSYISGAIARGGWTLSDGASYATPNFGWSGGSGRLEGGLGVIAFRGSVTFTGHGGILNTTVANPQLRLERDGSAFLLLDVSGTTQQGAAIDRTAVDFVKLDLSAARVTSSGSGLTATGVPARLTAAGAAAFGTYGAGSEFDPVSFTLVSTCAERELLPSPSAPAWVAWLLGGVGALAAVAVVMALIMRARRKPGRTP